jgi:hypothetical protein
MICRRVSDRSLLGLTTVPADERGTDVKDGDTWQGAKATG